AAVNPGTKKTFWDKLFGAVPRRPALKKTLVAELNNTLGELLTELKTLLYQPDEADHLVKREISSNENSNLSGGASAAALGANANIKAVVSAGQDTKDSLETKYSHTKIAVLQ